MKKILLTLCFALVGLTNLWAGNFQVKIGGKYVTSDNYTNITAANGFTAVKSGTVTYDTLTYTLTLSNAVIEAESGMAIELTLTTTEYKIVLAEGTTNTVTTLASGNALRTRAPLTIEGGGAVTFNSASHNGIHMNYRGTSSYTLTIRNCTVTTIGKLCGIVGNDYGTLAIDNATLKATGTETASIEGVGNLTLTGGVSIKQPAGAEWNETEHAICMAGETAHVTSEVVITNADPMTVNDNMKLNATRYDVNKDGKFTLADLTLAASALNGKANFPITSLTLSHPTLRVAKGGASMLRVNVAPDNADYKALSWTTSNKYIADPDAVTSRVNICGHREGTCTITVTPAYGSDVSATCEVTVVDPLFFDNGPGYVDLGLPSGTLWATCNVGATSPEEVGYYFAQGETTPKAAYTASNYAYDHTEFEAAGEPFISWYYDAAQVYWGTHWRMPTNAQLTELLSSGYTTKTTTTLNGKKGYLITSKMDGYTDRSIFLPFTGYMAGSNNYSASTYPFLWSRNYGCHWDVVLTSEPSRTYYGGCIRPVWQR